jgi:hypothetical protein
VYEEPTQDFRIRQETEEDRRHAEAFQNKTSLTDVDNIEASARYNVFGSVKDDSETWRDARQQMQQLFRLLIRPIDETHLPVIRQQYQGIITACNDYLNAHKGFRWTSVGRKRKQMMQDARDLAIVENNGIVEALALRRQSGVTGGNWTDLIADIRTEKVDLTGVHTDITGAQTSEVLVWGEENERTFFKDREILLPLDQQVQNKLLRNGPESGAYKSHASKLSKLLRIKESREKLFTYMIGGLNVEDDFAQKKNYLNLMYLRFLQDPIGDARLRDELAQDFTQNADALTEPLFDSFISIVKLTTRATMTEVAGIADGTELITRNTATSRMADLLGTGGSVARSRPVEVTIGNVHRIGNGMLQAKGTDYDHLDDEVKTALKTCPEFLCELTKLQMLDFICGQIDRHTGNYFVDAEMVGEGTERHLVFRSVTGIDNDLSFGTLRMDGNVAVEQLEQLIDTNGELKLPYVDRDLCDSILALTPEIVACRFCDILSVQEMSALMYRVRKLYTAIARLPEERKLSPEDWAEKMHEPDLAARYKAVRGTHRGSGFYKVIS